MGVLRLGGWSPHVQTGLHVSRLTQGSCVRFPVRGYHPLRRCFPTPSGTFPQNHWPLPRSLATTNGVSIDVLSSRYLDVSVPWVRLANLCIQLTIPLARWVAPFGDPRIKALTAPRGLSQRATSFIASIRQGIHQMPLSNLRSSPCTEIKLSVFCPPQAPAVASATLAFVTTLFLASFTLARAVTAISRSLLNPNGSRLYHLKLLKKL
jgi:hypothetical protein